MRIITSRVNKPFPIALLVWLFNLIKSPESFQLMNADVILLDVLFRLKSSALEFPGFTAASLEADKPWPRLFKVSSCPESVCLFILSR